VLATAFSGVLDFMDEESALLVPFRLVPVEDPQRIYAGQSWAEPNLSVAAAALTRLREEPELGARLRAAGQARVARQLSPQAWFETLPAKIQAAAHKAKAG
jgi:hypothetical protein